MRRVCIFAGKDIPAYTELTYDYGYHHSNHQPWWRVSRARFGCLAAPWLLGVFLRVLALGRFMRETVLYASLVHAKASRLGRLQHMGNTLLLQFRKVMAPTR